jgi:hypothetical protein
MIQIKIKKAIGRFFITFVSNDTFLSNDKNEKTFGREKLPQISRLKYFFIQMILFVQMIKMKKQLG